MDDDDSVAANGKHPVLYARRWYILAMFSLLTFLQSAWWITFSTVAIQVEEIFLLDEAAINLLLSWGMIIFIPAAPFAMFYLAVPEGGLRWSIVCSAILVFAATLIRCIPLYFPTSRWAYYFLSTGQILNSIGSPVLFSVPPQLSARWFPPSERTLATSIGIGFNYFGSGVAFMVNPLMVASWGFAWFMWSCCIVSGLVALAIIIYFPDAPPEPPSISESLADNKRPTLAEFKDGILDCLSNPSFLALITVGSVVLGFTSAWTSIFDFILIPTFTEDTVGLLDTLSNTAGSIFCGFVADRFFRQRSKALILIYLALTALALTIWTLSFSSFFTPNQLPLFNFPKWVIMVLISVIGLLVGAALPLFFELGVEITYPIKESYSMGLLTVAINVFALVLIVPETYVPLDWNNGIVTLAISAMALLMIAVKEEYRREKLDSGHTGGSPTGDTAPAVEETTPLIQ